MSIGEVKYGAVQELATLDNSPPNGLSLNEMIGAHEILDSNEQTPVVTAKMDISFS